MSVAAPARDEAARSRALAPLLLCVALVAALHPALYLGMFAGDAEIHLVFARNAAEGRFFEFNPGEAVAGETSPGYMLLVASLFRAAPEAWVPLLVKMLGVLSWYAVVALVWVAARRLVGDRWALAATAVVALMPGAVYNATVGMENGLFALVVLGFWTAAIRTGWFEASEDRSAHRDAALGALLGIGCWLRPEGFVVAAIAIGCRGLRRSMVALAACAALAAGAVLFHLSLTGRLVPGSALARATISANDAFAIGPIPLNPRFAVRLGAYLPLTAGFGLASWLALSRRLETPSAGAVRFAVACFWAFFALYSTLLGASQLGRYTIFLMPQYAIVAALGAQWAWCRWRARPGARVALVVGSLALLAVFSVEAAARRDLGRSQEVIAASEAPASRAEYSALILDRLGRPEERPVVVACQEVQIRYWLDDRFVVRSLDGRVDPVLLGFVHDGVYDHVGYLKARNVRFLLDTPNYNRGREGWALDRLGALGAGESLAHDGLRFTRLAEPGMYRVDPDTSAVAGN